MDKGNRFWAGYLIPLVVSVAVFNGLNALWNAPPAVSGRIPPYLQQAVVVYMLGGSGLALVFLARAVQRGRLMREDLGLGPAGWTAPRRLLGLAVLVLAAYGGFATGGPPPGQADAPARVTWGEFCFWFVVVLSASTAELLVYLGMAFCLLQRGLRDRGLGRVPAGLIATAAACVLFGLYHYTYEPRWWPYAFPLMFEMFLMVLFFLATRNFYLTLLLHNTMATLGFVSQQYSPDPQDPALFSAPLPLTLNLIAFVVPFLLLHALEWRGRPRPGPVSGPPAADFAPPPSDSRIAPGPGTVAG